METEEYLKIIGQFFPLEWCRLTASDVDTQTIDLGSCNEIVILQRKDVISKSSEPLSVLVKKRRQWASELEDFSSSFIPLVAYEMGRHGLGPQIYGLFKDGSIEEYIDSHVLTQKESMDPAISHDIACSLAEVHSITDLPMKLNSPGEFIDSECLKMIPTKRDYWLKHDIVRLCNVDVDYLFSFNFVAEMSWLLSFTDHVEMRKTFILGDRNFTNCLVRDDPKEQQSKVVQIDYDMCQYGFRGIDLGSHFLYQHFELKDDGNYNIHEIEEEIKRTFLEVYQEKVKRLNVFKDFNDETIDSIENLLMESNFGECYNALWICSYILGYPELFLVKFPSFSQCLPYMIRRYYNLKQILKSYKSM